MILAPPRPYQGGALPLSYGSKTVDLRQLLRHFGQPVTTEFNMNKRTETETPGTTDAPQFRERSAWSDDEVVDEWHRWNDYIAELSRSGLGSREAAKMRLKAECELDRRGILIPGKRAT